MSYDYFHRTQDVISGNEPDSLADDTTHRAKIQLRYKWLDTSLSYDDYDSNVSSARTTWQLRQGLHFKPIRQLSLNLLGYYGNTSFKDSGQEEDVYGVATNIYYHPAYWCKVGLEGFYDSIDGDTQDTLSMGVYSFLELYYGKWTFNLSYRHMDYNDQLNDVHRQDQKIMLKIIWTIW